MKAFLAQNKYRRLQEEKDYLIIATTKKEALNTFISYNGDFQYSAYLKKDFIEVEIETLTISSLDITPKNINYGLASCYEFGIHIKFKPHAQYNEQLISEDDKTIKELVKIFKEENSNFFNCFF